MQQEAFYKNIQYSTYRYTLYAICFFYTQRRYRRRVKIAYYTTYIMNNEKTNKQKPFDGFTATSLVSFDGQKKKKITDSISIKLSSRYYIITD